MSAYTWEQIVEDYRAAGGAWPFKKAEVVEWAMAHDRWKPSAADLRRAAGDSLAAAMREASFTDESGREVRRMLPAKTTRGGEQGTFWDDLRTAPINHLRIGFANRRGDIVAQCYHLNKMVRYSNEHRGAEDQIKLILDFTDDVREMDQSSKPEAVRPPKLTLVTPTPSSSEPAQPPAPPRPSAPGSASRRGTSRPSYRPSARARRLRDSSAPPPDES